MAMVVPHATRPNPSERQFVLCDVQNRVIDRNATRYRLFQHLVNAAAIVVKHIQRQRPRPRIDVVNGRFNATIGNNRQDRTEDLVLHHFHLIGDVEQNHRRETPRDRIRFHHGQRNDGRPLGPGIFQIPGKALIVARIDHGAVVRRARHFRETGRQYGARSSDEILLCSFRQQYVVGGNAGLPGIQGLADENAVGCLCQRIAGCHDHRRLAPQLQGNGSEIVGSSMHHMMADCCRTGEEQVIKRQCRKFVGDGGIPLHNGDFVCVKMTGQQIGKQGRGRRRELGHFHQDAIAGRKRRRQGSNGKVEGIVPRDDHTNDTERLTAHFGATRLKPQ